MYYSLLFVSERYLGLIGAVKQYDILSCAWGAGEDLDCLELDWRLEQQAEAHTLELNHKHGVLFCAQSEFFLTTILSQRRVLCGEGFFYLGLGWPPALKQHAAACIVLLLLVEAL